jgi:dipeptidyl aminopeptidase/acylaminoacyl peptidase
VDRVRARRASRRKVAGVLLTLAVLAATAGGFFFLRHVFDPDKRNVADEQTPAVANGEIVFSRGLPDGSEHLFAVQPGVVGERLITSGSAIYADPSVAPDGRAIAVVHSIPSFADMNAEGVLATLTMDGGEPTWITDPLPRVRDPSWSPQGDRIAFAASTSDGRLPGIYVVGADGSGMRLVAELDGFTLSAPDWSPDGRELVFVGLAAATSEAEPVSPDLYTVGIDGSGLTALTETPAVSEWSPSWSPEGDVIAYHRNEGNTSNSIELIDSTGRPAGTVFDDADAGEIGEVDWSPDGRIIAFTSSLALTDTDDEGDLDVWTVRVDGSQLTNLTTEGASGISWQPVPAGSEPEPSPTSEPAESASPEPEGRDIGLGFNVCHAERLGGIDLIGDGTEGLAWIGVPQKEDGSCPEFTKPGKFMVAVDFTGDRLADSWVDLPWLCYNGCALADATDLDANGSEELIVRGYFSILDYWVLAVRPNDAGEMVVEPILAASPGHEPAQITAGEPLRIDAGGDAGYSSVIWCDNYPDDPVIVWAWVYGPVESEQPNEVHITRLQLQPDGLIHIVGTNDYTIPASEYWGYGDRTEPACGVDWAYRA